MPDANDVIFHRFTETLPGLKESTWTDMARKLDYTLDTLKPSQVYCAFMQCTYDEAVQMCCRKIVIANFVAAWMDTTPWPRTKPIYVSDIDFTISKKDARRCFDLLKEQTDTKKVVACIFQDGTTIARLVDTPIL